MRQGVTTEVIGVDGNSYAPFRSADGPARLRAPERRPRRPARHRLRLGQRGLLPRAARRRRAASTWPCSSATRRCASTRVGWDDVPADERGARPDARAAARVDGGRRLRPLVRARLPAGQLRHAPRSSRRSRARRRASAASTTPTSATRSATATSTRSGRPSTSAGAARARSTSRTSITGPSTRGRPSELIGLVEDARAGGLDVTWDTYPYEWAWTRLLIQLPQWVQSGGPMPRWSASPIARGARPDPRRDGSRSARAYANQDPYANIRLGYFATRRVRGAGRGAPSASSCARPARMPWTPSATSSSPRTCGPTRSRAGR